jgi:hypothetical protein
MKSLSPFMSRILPHVSGCPDVLAQEALLDTAIEFCEKTLVVQQTLDPLPTVSGEVEYTLEAPAHQAVVMPVAAWFNTTMLKPVAANEVRNVQAYTNFVSGFELAEGDPTHYFWVAPGSVGMYPIPDATTDGTITVRAALKPTRTATQLEDVLFDDWIDPLVSGTLARLHASKDQIWSSADRSLLRSREFRAGVQRARIEQSMGRIRTTLRVQLRGF